MKAEIKQLHEDDIGLKGKCDTKRKADIRARMRAKSGKEKVTDVPKDNMTKEQAQKVLTGFKIKKEYISTISNLQIQMIILNLLMK